jgi:CsoR family transcriptional regulator, copper-sensing transcriptional repressor
MALMTESTQTDLQMRLRRIEGQIRGIIGMLADGKPCEDVVTQIFAARAGMDRVATEVLKCHVTDALSSRPPEEAREAVLRAISLLNKV